MRLRRTLIALALLLAATGAHAQTPSDRQLRQRCGWTLTQIRHALTEANDRAARDSIGAQLGIIASTQLTRSRAMRTAAIAAEGHAIILCDGIQAQINAADADTIPLPPPPPVDTVPPPDTTATPPAVSLTGDWQAPGVVLSITQDGTDLHGFGNEAGAVPFTGEMRGDSVLLVFDNGPVFRGVLVDTTRIVGTLTGSTWSVTWPLERIAPPPVPGELLDIVLTMAGAQGADFAMQVGDVREFCALGLYSIAGAIPPLTPVTWSVDDPTTLQLGAQGPTGAHCIMATALRETDDALGWGVPAQAVAWIDARRVR